MLKAFVGHSFSETDRKVVRIFLDFFDQVVNMGIGFTWDHAEAAEPKELSLKVKEKMEGKNLFIGICTQRERVIDITNLSQTPILRTRAWGLKNDFQTKPSDWLLQEIGFAFGRDMKLIILLEAGTRRPGGIQGDIEYISFNRENPEKSFPKIIDMLTALRPSAVSPEQKEVQSESVIADQRPESGEVLLEENAMETPRPDWKREQFEGALVSAVMLRDEGREQELTDKYYQSEPGLDPKNRIAWRSYLLYLKIAFRNESLLNELLRLDSENPDNPDVLSYLGGAYASFSAHERAALYFEKGASLTQNIARKFHRLSAAATNYAKSGQMEKAITINRQSLLLAHNPELTKAEVFITQAQFYETINDFDRYKVFSEAALEVDPGNHYRRFSLAYRYSEDGENNLAVYHYRILTEKQPDGTTWNNLGVALERLGLTALAIDAYRTSEELGETLAMSNIAFRFISAGFLEEANKLVNAAISKENYHSNIGNVITSIRDTRENQTNEVDKMLDSLLQVRQYYSEYANAYLEDNLEAIPENWQGPSVSLIIKIENGSIEIVNPTGKVKYIGKITGHTALYQAWNWEADVPIQADAKPKSKGMLVFNINEGRIRILEQGARKDNNVIELKLSN